MNMVYFEVKRQILTTNPTGPAYHVTEPPYLALVFLGGKHLFDLVKLDATTVGQIIVMVPKNDWALVWVGGHQTINRTGPFVSCTAKDLRHATTLASAKQILEFYARI